MRKGKFMETKNQPSPWLSFGFPLLDSRQAPQSPVQTQTLRCPSYIRTITLHKSCDPPLTLRFKASPLIKSQPLEIPIWECCKNLLFQPKPITPGVFYHPNIILDNTQMSIFPLTIYKYLLPSCHILLKTREPSFLKCTLEERQNSSFQIFGG